MLLVVGVECIYLRRLMFLWPMTMTMIELTTHVGKFEIEMLMLIHEFMT